MGVTANAISLFPPTGIEYLDEFNRIVGPDDSSYHNRSIYEGRENGIHNYSFAIPTDAALDVISKYAPIIEMGSGSGYWAHLLRQKGVDIMAYDKYPPTSVKNPWRITKTWTGVLYGRPPKLKKHTNRSLFICWPPYNTPMGTECLKHYRGRHFIYIGESHYGCTGDDEFHQILEKEWDEIEEVRLPTWPAIHDYLVVYLRKE